MDTKRSRCFSRQILRAFPREVLLALSIIDRSQPMTVELSQVNRGSRQVGGGQDTKARHTPPHDGVGFHQRVTLRLLGAVATSRRQQPLESGAGIPVLIMSGQEVDACLLQRLPSPTHVLPSPCYPQIHARKYGGQHRRNSGSERGCLGVHRLVLTEPLELINGRLRGWRSILSVGVAFRVVFVVGSPYQIVSICHLEFEKSPGLDFLKAQLKRVATSPSSGHGPDPHHYVPTPRLKPLP